MIQATFVGTGTAFSRRYGNTNVLLEKGSTALMIDFGFTSPERLNTMGRSLREITHVAVSHIHADHIGGLEELAFMSRFVFGRRPHLLMPPGVADELWSHALRGGLELTADNAGETLTCSLETYFRPLTLDNTWVRAGALEIKSFTVDHVPGKACYGFIVRDPEDGSQMIFGCDVRRRLAELVQEPLPEDFVRGPIFHDCQLYDDGPSRVHIPFVELLSYPASVRERIVLVHYNDSILDHLPAVYQQGFQLVWPRDVVRVPGWREWLDKNRRSSPSRGNRR